MKNSIRLTKLALSLSTPALCTWLLAGRDLSIEMLFSAYALAGLFFLTTAEYAPRRPYFTKSTNGNASRQWIRTSILPSRRSRISRREKELVA